MIGFVWLLHQSLYIIFINNKNSKTDFRQNMNMSGCCRQVFNYFTNICVGLDLDALVAAPSI
jgi:hypothetical protein